jgi:hypothetical protein
MQRPGKRVRAVNETTTETLCVLGSCRRIILKATDTTSTVTLRVVGGDEKGNLSSETVKYGHETKGTRTQEGMRRRGPVACTKDRPVLS